MNFTPFSENIIFCDTEFTSLDPYEGELLSIGLIRLNGEECYIEIAYEGKISEWVKENVVHFFEGPKVSREDAPTKICDFVGTNQPFMISHVNQFDAIYVYKLFGVEHHPFHWIPIDFASILFGLGINPESYYHGHKDNFFKQLGVDHTKYRRHHALDDAKLLREVYLKLLEIKNDLL